MKIILKLFIHTYLPIAIILAASCCACAGAQATGELRGSVTDPTGALIPDASVTVTQQASNFSRTVRTDTGGIYVVSALPAGVYQIEIAARGFSGQIVKNVVIAAGQSLTKDIQLKVAAASTEIVVTDTSNPAGSYKVPTTDFGPLGNITALDTPYTVVAVPTNLMENEGVRKFSDVLKYLPGAQMEPRSGMDVGRPQTRGFEGTVSQNARIDGMNIAATTQYPMEQFDRIEVQNGLVGSEYGAATPSGNFNFILKRPTQDTTAKVSLDLDTPTTGTLNGDLGGMITKYFGYRIDALHTNGAGYIEKSHHQREMLNSSVDIHPWRRGVLQLNGSEFAAHDYGFPPNFAYGGSSTVKGITYTNTVFPKAPNLNLSGLGQTWAGMDLWTRTMSARFLQDFNSNWHLTLGGLHQSVNRLFLTLTNTIYDNSGDFSQKLQNASDGIFFNNSTLGYLKGHFRTYGFTHDVTLGTNGNVTQTASAGSAPTATVRGASVTSGVNYSNLYNPTTTSGIITGSFSSFNKGSTATNEGFIASDTIQFARRWMLQFIGAEVWIRDYAFTKGVISNTYDVNGFAPSASIMYKPATNLTTYFTYASSLYNGDSYTNSATVVYTNPGYLPPYRSKQYEAGYKWDFHGAEVAIAGYRMTRPLPYLQYVSSTSTGTTYTAMIEGTQQNDGLDLTVTGKVTRDLNIFGGLTWLNSELTGTSFPATNNKQVTGVPRIQSSFLLEYEVPKINGLAVNGNWHHTGVKAGDDLNMMWVPKYDTFDLGVRYDQHLQFGDVAWRLSVANVGNVNYWYGIFPGGSGLSGQSVTTVAGQTVSGNSAFLGTPRILSASVQYRFAKQR